jgi:hypothetical protein
MLLESVGIQSNKINLVKMDQSINRSSLSAQNKGRGELNVNLVYAILVVSAIAFLILVCQIR